MHQKVSSSTAAFALYTTKLRLQTGNFSLGYSHLKLVGFGCMIYFCYLERNNVTSSFTLIKLIMCTCVVVLWGIGKNVLFGGLH